MIQWKQLSFIAVVAISVPVGTSALGQTKKQENNQKTTNISPRNERIQRHEEFAQLHKQAANCLRSGKTLDECNHQMKKNCPKEASGQCVSMTETELQRHRKSHEMAGSIGKDEPEALDIIPKVK